MEREREGMDYQEWENQEESVCLVQAFLITFI
jgi:hypothetical protein